MLSALVSIAGVMGRSLDSDETLAASGADFCVIGAVVASAGVSGRADVGASALTIACSIAGRTLKFFN